MLKLALGCQIPVEKGNIVSTVTEALNDVPDVNRASSGHRR